MTHSNSTTVIAKNDFFSAINLLLQRDSDQGDQLALRAVRIIMATDLPQTGYEVNVDPFLANEFATSALLLLNDHKHYPFIAGHHLVKASRSDWNATLRGASDFIETAEKYL